jgi:predicted nucleotidyltransferase
VVIPPEVEIEIMSRLARIEREESVSIVLAVESGSRAWGFPSPDSDYDVRFVYSRPVDWYLAVDLDQRRDVIERDIVDEIDLNGWDVRKALRLLGGSNPAIVEWLQSPIRYLERGAFAASASALLPDVYSQNRGIHHYRSMATSNFRGYLRADNVPLKKYFYVLRPLLAVRWIERYESPPPVEFEKLFHLVTDEVGLLDEVRSLLERKRGSPELGLAPPIAAIDRFVEDELLRLSTLASTREVPPGIFDRLNALFRATLGEMVAASSHLTSS